MLDAWEVAALISFVVAAAAFALVALLLYTSGKERRSTGAFVAAALSASAWAVFSGYATLTDLRAAWLVPLADSLLISVWVSSFAPMIGTTRSMLAVGIRLPVLVVSSVWGLTGLVAAIQSLQYFTRGVVPISTLSSVALLIEALAGLLLIEQIYRNSAMRQREVWLPLAMAAGALFAANVFIYTQAVLYSDIEAVSWLIRGVVVACCAPAILVTIKRQPEWETQLFISRHIVFYTATMTAVGVYLMLMALAAYLIGLSDQAWGAGAQLAFLLIALVALFYAIFSSELRSRVKVFIAKNFYRNKFDYRIEWINLIALLVDGSGGLAPAERGIRALASIHRCRSGQLWMRDRASGEFVGRAGWNTDRPTAALDPHGPLVSFLGSQRWVVDTEEVGQDPEKYSNAFNEEGVLGDEPSIYVPLIMDDSLTGIVRLERPAGLATLDYEDHDLLKTAGQQVAIYIIQEQSKEELSRARQFEAFTRLTTFLMHDLKNLIAQQELVVTNAKRFGDRPEFVQDAFRTIEGGVERMRAVLARLRESAGTEHVSLLRLDRLLNDACTATSDRRPAPVVTGAVGDATISADRDRLTAALVHAIRNSQDATGENGRIDIAARVDGKTAVVVIEDNGAGMSREFIDTRLFRPFDSTKGAQGMGIGAYQIREAVTGAGGSMLVTSEEGEGTRVELRLPIVQPADAREQESRDASAPAQ